MKPVPLATTHAVPCDEARPTRDEAHDAPVKPVLFVTGHAPPYRAAGLGALHERERIEVALFGGRLAHGGGASAEELPFPHRFVSEREVHRLAASGHHRAVVCSTAGRVALPAAWTGARRARLPLILWSSLWAHPRSPAHALSFVALRRLYRSADAVVTYGTHVEAYVRARGARNTYVAPQAVDNDFWAASDVRPPEDPRWPGDARVKFLFAGRPVREKGLGVLGQAWTISGLGAPTAALVLVGAGSSPPWTPAGGAVCMDPVSTRELRNLYAAADVLVVPSIATPNFREPWGLVINEAMNRGLPVVATDAVGAVAGGLVRDGRNGLVVPAGDARALAEAMRRLAGEGTLRERLGAAAREDVAAYTPTAWAEGFSAALASLGQARRSS
jgi:glycosyltransferase involved in cell wall biosynthesis